VTFRIVGGAACNIVMGGTTDDMASCRVSTLVTSAIRCCYTCRDLWQHFVMDLASSSVRTAVVKCSSPSGAYN